MEHRDARPSRGTGDPHALIRAGEGVRRDSRKSWLADELPRLIEQYDVPAAAVAVLADGEVIEDATGDLSTSTGWSRGRATAFPRAKHCLG